MSKTEIRISNLKPLSIRNSVIFVAVGLIASGCGKVNQVGAILADEPLTIVLAPGAKVTVDGERVSLQGFEKCPEANPAFFKFVGSAIPAAGSPTCALISAQTSVVSVNLALSTGPSIEHWKVTRKDGRIALQRPNGSFIGEAD